MTLRPCLAQPGRPSRPALAGRLQRARLRDGRLRDRRAGRPSDRLRSAGRPRTPVTPSRSDAATDPGEPQPEPGRADPGRSPDPRAGGLAGPVRHEHARGSHPGDGRLPGRSPRHASRRSTPPTRRRARRAPSPAHTGGSRQRVATAQDAEGQGIAAAVLGADVACPPHQSVGCSATRLEDWSPAPSSAVMTSPSVHARAYFQAGRHRRSTSRSMYSGAQPFEASTPAK